MTEVRESTLHQLGDPRSSETGARWRYALAALLAIVVLSAGFSRDFRLPGLYMDSINPEYLAVRAVVDDVRPDTPAWVLPGNLIADKYPILAGSYYHGPLQYYLALPVYAALGTDLDAARTVQLMYGLLVLLAMTLLLLNARVAPALAAVGLALLALDPAFMLALKTQAYNITWPLAWFFLAAAVTEHWGTRRLPPKAWQSLLTGLLAGIAFFCYFVFLFFLPALAIYLVGRLQSAGVRGFRPQLGIFALHGIGFAVGGAPYLWGYQRSAEALGGWGEFIAQHRGNVESLVVQTEPAGLLEKFAKTWNSVRTALDDEWVSRMVLQAPGSDLLDEAKVAILLVAPLALLVVLRMMKLRSRLLDLCVMAVVSYAVISTLAFGNKLAPHHFTLLPPLLYVGIAAGLSTAWPRIRATSRRPRLATTAGVALLSALLLVDSIVGQALFSARLRQTGGVGLYSDAINAYAERALADREDTAYHLPTWGLMMPFVYLTGGREVTRMRAPTGEQVRGAVCNGRAVEVAYIPVNGAATYAESIGAETKLTPSMLTFASRDGRPTIAVVRFDSRPDAGSVPACDGFRPHRYQTWVRDPGSHISLAPSEASCDSGDAITRVSWDLPTTPPRSVSIWVDNGKQRKLWANTSATGQASTGPWARAGLRFEVIEQDTNQLLATATLGGKPCL